MACIWPQSIDSNKEILSPRECELVELLLELGQSHLFDDWDPAGVNDDHKHAFFEQVRTLHETYTVNGGLSAYISRSRLLLEKSKNGDNPFQGWIPEIPTGTSLDPLTEEFLCIEKLGFEYVGCCAFVLVAGGLGERLGYSGIKVALPTETTTMKCYLEFYCHSIDAIQKRYAHDRVKKIPFAIMVSEDTMTKTAELLRLNAYFGLEESQIILMKQEKVAALLDNEAHIAKVSKYEIDSKPHGHGDVHSLLYRYGLVDAWLKRGIKYVTFFQDTNALAMYLLPAMIGVSEQLQLDVNSMTIPRYAKQAVGAITKLVHSDGRSITVNVEYNQLDPLLRSTINPEGDVNDPVTGTSPFPGNINQLLFKLEPYSRVLGSTQGVMGEFVNPKYTDSSRSVFKKPTRLECMMQDYPKVLGIDSGSVGFTKAPAWICYSPVKNNAADAAASAAIGVPAGSALQGESDQYFAAAEILRRLGAEVELGDEVSYLGLSAPLGPRIVIEPSTCLFPGEFINTFPTPKHLFISKRSTLLIRGDVIIESLRLDGSVRLYAPPGSRLVVRAGTYLIQNKGHDIVGAHPDAPEEIAMRGYTVTCAQMIEVEAPDDGKEHTFDGRNLT